MSYNITAKHALSSLCTVLWIHKRGRNCNLYLGQYQVELGQCQVKPNYRHPKTQTAVGKTGHNSFCLQLFFLFAIC